MATSLPVCPRCGAPRILAPECPHCGVIYAKAHAAAHPSRPLQPAPPPVRAAPPEEPASLLPPEPVRPPHLNAQSAPWSEETPDDVRLELQLKRLALPIALGLASLAVGPGFGGMLLRTFLSMWIHELGHAVTAWFCGHLSFPGPWFTPDFGRSLLVPPVLAGALGYWTYRSWKAESFLLAATGAALLAVQLVCTALLNEEQARMLITFGGDGGCLVLGSALMATFYVRRDSPIHQNWLRWGFLVIGAVAFMDAFEQWWSARSDVDRVPLGENEGVGLSDPSKLTEVHGWSITQLIHRYTTLGLVCLAALAVLYLLGLRQARARTRA